MSEARNGDLPIKLDSCSNGEFVPPPPSAVVRETMRRTRASVVGSAVTARQVNQLLMDHGAIIT